MLPSAEQAYILAHLTADVRALLLNPPAKPALNYRLVAEQIQARQKAREKLPRWYANPDLVFPAALSVEQASSEQTAAYKASLVSGSLLIDLTGGMGVDAAAFAGRVGRVIYVERNAQLAQLTAHNLRALGHSNVDFISGDGLEQLACLPTPADWAYLDPARRDDRGGRVVQLADCEPDVLDNLPLLLAKANQILLKTAPLLDIEATLRLLPTTQAVHVVAVQGEVKETLFVLGQTPTDPANVLMNAVNLRSNMADHQLFTFFRGEEAAAPVMLADPQTYLYEPNAAVLKTGAFRLIGQRFGLAKLAPHSHLYTSGTLVDGFPGRTFQVVATCKPDRAELRKLLPDQQANLTVRNFPETVAQLRQKLALREGGNTYIFATTFANNAKRLLVTEKV
ncbi:THUMP-like domain-containing protein [Fibrella aquatilis]|uniref:SAM-dependent methyltransferase n=1 Tax=Fibrella aquatilis TaxID=2817059 RepID=A0A939G7B7_9BACT|nr:SAM-dependent methyltransferase [Fibrella aquatilis]MBO0931487.1 SAM-dependent methyltransferase [Fibrella aquatilis]